MTGDFSFNHLSACNYLLWWKHQGQRSSRYRRWQVAQGSQAPGATSPWHSWSSLWEQTLTERENSDCHCECWDGPAFPLVLTHRTLLCGLCEVPFPHWMSGEVSNFQEQELFVSEIIKFQSLAMDFEHVLILPVSPTFFSPHSNSAFFILPWVSTRGVWKSFLNSLFYRWKCKQRHGKHQNPVSERKTVLNGDHTSAPRPRVRSHSWSWENTHACQGFRTCEDSSRGLSKS